MALTDYIRETWQNAVTAINATRLNNVETGLDAVTDGVRFGTGGPDVVVLTAAATLTDATGTALLSADTAGFTVTLPTAVGRRSKRFTFKNISGNSNAITIDPAGTELIDTSGTVVTATIGEAFTIESDGTNWRTVVPYGAPGGGGGASSFASLLKAGI